MTITNVELVQADGSPLPNTCIPGQQTVAVKLKVTFNATSKTRYGFLIVGDLTINGSSAGKIYQCYGEDFAQGDHTRTLNQIIQWPCGSTLSLTHVYTAWDNQPPSTTICSYLNADGSISNCGAIDPKCRYYGDLSFTVATPLIAGFTPLEGVCNGLNRTWTFTSTTSGGKTPYTNTWNFGDGSPNLVTTQNPVTHEYPYAAAGNHTITLSVEDASTPTHQTSVAQSQIISVTSCCVASTNPTSANAASPSICLGGNTNISVSGGFLGTGASWKWYLGGCGNGQSIGTGATINVNPTQTTTFYVRAEGDCGTTNCASVQVVVNPPSVGGVLAENRTICSGSNSGLLSLTGNTGTVQRWESSTTSAVAGFSSISNTAGLTSFTSGALTQDTWFRVVVKSGVCAEANSNAIKITVQQPISNNTIAADQTICSGYAPNSLTGSTPSGGSGSYSYQWKWKTTGSFTNISAATNKDYAPGSLIQTAYFQRIVSGGVCNTSTSNTVAISISPESAVYAITASDFCSTAPGTGVITLLGSYPGVSYQLKLTSDNSDIQGAQTGTGSALTWTGLNAGTYYVFGTGIAPSHCTSRTGNATVHEFDCSYFYTLTQGYYGGKNGKSCLGSTPVNTIKYLLGIPNNPTDLVTGTTNSVTIPATDDGAKKLNGTMPGGNTPGALPAGTCTITTGCFVEPTYLTKQGRINNILLSQTITLGLNSRWEAGKLLLFHIESGWLTTQKMNGCGNDAIVVTTCGSNTVTSIKMNQNVVNYLGANNTVQDLLNLANAVLGGTLTPGTNGVPSYSDVNDAVSAINEAFDEGRRFLDYYPEKQTCELLFPAPIIAPPIITQVNTTVAKTESIASAETTVTAYPNPYTDQVSFSVDAKVSGYGSLEVYNMMGQKLRTVYQGYILAGRQKFTLSLPTRQRSNLVYILRMGNKQITGKLLQLSK